MALLGSMIMIGTILRMSECFFIAQCTEISSIKLRVSRQGQVIVGKDTRYNIDLSVRNFDF